MAPLGKLEKGSGRFVGGQLCGHGSVPHLVQVAVKAGPEGAAPAKSRVFFYLVRENLVTARQTVWLCSLD